MLFGCLYSTPLRGALQGNMSAKAAGMDDFSANIAAVSTGVSMGAFGAGELPVPQVDNPYLADMSEEALREWLSEAFLRQMYGQMGR